MRSFTVSLRSKAESRPALKFIRNHFGYIPIGEIESVWGFYGSSPLYGGRIFTKPEISDSDVSVLNSAGIGIRLPLSNHFFSDSDYDKSRSILDQLHSTLNSVIVFNDELATRIRNDYPKYKIEASVIKNIRTLNRVEKTLKLYDTVVIPMDLNDDIDLLRTLPKPKIRLFANALCAYSCPSKICYVSFSKMNRGESVKPLCSATDKKRDFHGVKEFDVDKFERLGFTKFKVLHNRDYLNA